MKSMGSLIGMRGRRRCRMPSRQRRWLNRSVCVNCVRRQGLRPTWRKRSWAIQVAHAARRIAYERAEETGQIRFDEADQMYLAS